MASLGFCPQGSVWRAEHSFGMRTLVRIQLWWWRGRGVTGVVPAMSSAAAEARVQVGMGLRCANERGEVPRRLYAMRGARWAHARDQMVTGASPATSAGGGACGWMWCGSYGVRERERRRESGEGAHCGCVEENGELGEEPEQAGRRWRSRRTEVEEDGVAGVCGRPVGCCSVRRSRGSWRSF